MRRLIWCQSITWTLLASALSSLVPAAARACELKPVDMFRATHWFGAEGSKVLGVMVAVHGLNAEPARLNPLIVAVNNMGVEILRLDLHGHRNNDDATANPTHARLQAFKHVTAKGWHHELLCAQQQAAARAAALGVPLYFLGHSLGALLAVELLNSAEPNVYFDGMVLLAPAIRLRWYTHLVLLLAAFPRLVLPSESPPSYRANQEGTPLAAYSALFRLRRRVENINRPRVNIPTLIFVDEADELVSAVGLRHMILSQRLSRWRGFSIRRDQKMPEGSFHHLIVDPQTIGPHAWDAMLGTIRRELIDAHH